MNLDGVNTENESIRKIEDIIDIQKANGNFSNRQVVFKIPTETVSTVSTNLAQSLETGLSKSKSDLDIKKIKKFRYNRQKSPLPDVISWPSDSDITVLRMKMFMTSNSKDLKKKVGNLITGDGLHQPDSSSMVNLATLIRHSQRFNMEEYLMPLTSWEREQEQESESIEEPRVDDGSKLAEKIDCDYDIYKAVCSRTHKDGFSSKDSQSCYSSKKSKFARFLRLYFCPCCTCLYKLEKMGEDPSVYLSKRKELTAC